MVCLCHVLWFDFYGLMICCHHLVISNDKIKKINQYVFVCVHMCVYVVLTRFISHYGVIWVTIVVAGVMALIRRYEICKYHGAGRLAYNIRTRSAPTNARDISKKTPQIAKFMGPKWDPPGSCRSQMGPMLAQWTLLSGTVYFKSRRV